MKTILFQKLNGNHLPENAQLSIYATFNSYEEAQIKLNELLETSFSNTSTNEDFEDYTEEQMNYWAIYKEGDNNYVDNKFFHNENE